MLDIFVSAVIPPDMPDRALDQPVSSRQIFQGSKGQEAALAWRNVGEERSAEDLTKDIPDQTVCSPWSTKCGLFQCFLLMPDGKLASCGFHSLKIPRR